MTRKVMRALRTQMGDKIELIGQGKKNMRGVEKLCIALGRWVKILSVNSGKSDKDKAKDVGNKFERLKTPLKQDTLVVRLQSASGFGVAYKEALKKAKDDRRMKKFFA